MRRFLLEIGSEELPASDAWAAINQLGHHVKAIFASRQIPVEEKDCLIFATPRRIAVLVPLDGADKIDPRGLEEVAVSLIKSLRFAKSMRWLPGESLSFSRPIRWLVALLDDQLLTVEYAGVKSGRVSYGPRFLGSPQIEVTSAQTYVETLAKHRIILDQQQRRRMISEQIARLAKEAGGRALEDPRLLDEVVQLVEYPTAVLGNFDGRFLKIPREVIITIMAKHQRCFALEDDQGRLLPHFITVTNQLPRNSRVIRRGNEKVIGARLADGEFFYQQDRRRRLEDFVSELEKITFHEKLGTVADKTQRLEKMVPDLIKSLGVPQELEEKLVRGAHLCKADLATALVVEFPHLQGVIGRIYALEDGEDQGVAWAIEEHYRPRFSGDKLPQSLLGQLLAVADRVDTLTSFFAVGLKPSGSQDPYALRRAALGLVQLLVAMRANVKVGDLFGVAQKYLPVELHEQRNLALVDFVIERMHADLKEEGFEEKLIRAVLSGPSAQNPYLVYTLTRGLSKHLKEERFGQLVEVARRVKNILGKEKVTLSPQAKLFKEPAESKLYEVYRRVAQKITPSSIESIPHLLNSYYELIEPVNFFFDEVLVMAEDQKIRQNRLALLTQVDALLNRFLDLSLL